MRITLTILLSFLVIAVNSQNLFEPGSMIAGGLDDVEAVSAADLDGDGDFDILVASSDDDRVVWF
ncbi:MAG: hypothetical protein AAF193_03030, partial [Bacteroidota bacterium]